MRGTLVAGGDIIGSPTQRSVATYDADIFTKGPASIFDNTSKAGGNIVDHTLRPSVIKGDIRAEDSLEYKEDSMIAAGDIRYSPEKRNEIYSQTLAKVLKKPAVGVSENAMVAHINHSPDDIRSKTFQVALSFAGENRAEFIEPMLQHLDEKFGRKEYFYDNHFTHQLAQPNLDDILQNVYGKAKLVVVVISKHYPDKNWCNNVEWRKIREHIFEGNGNKIMFLLADDGQRLPSGIMRQDGYIDLRRHTAEQSVALIKQRYNETYPSSISTPINRNVELNKSYESMPGTFPESP
jgi:hypothetical protein